ncbi:MAG: SUMF1/EgtB/PvdO family nonheme iron enzyme [Bacteroidia bacterium]
MFNDQKYKIGFDIRKKKMSYNRIVLLLCEINIHPKMQYRNILLALISFFLFFSGNDGRKTKKEAPPGTVWLRDNIYIDVTPLVNNNCLELEEYMRHFNFNLECFKAYKDSMIGGDCGAGRVSSKIYCDSNPDSNKIKIDYQLPVSWNSYTTYLYLRNAKYQFYPCINISYETAKLFCEWRTQIAMLQIARNKKNTKKAGQYYSELHYRLPTKEEWEYALTKFKDKLYSPSPVLDSTCFVSPCYFRNKKIIYRLSNISEMVLEEGIAKGMNWKDSTSNNNLNFTAHYSQPSDWLGFRCVCEVKE